MKWVVNATPRPVYPRERPGTYCTRGWVGPRAGLVGCGKSRPPSGFDPRTFQPLASRYTDYAIPAPQNGQYDTGMHVILKLRFFFKKKAQHVPIVVYMQYTS